MSLFGKPTIAELKDLIAAKDYTLAQMQKAYIAIANDWAQRDIAAQTDWFADFNSLQVRYAAARKDAESAIMLAKVNPNPNNMIVAEAEWNEILQAIRKVDGIESKGDLQELDRRIQAAGANPDYSQMPQPAVDSDADLNLFKQADVVAKIIAPVVQGTKAAVPWVLIGIGAVVVGALYLASKVAPVGVPLATGGVLRVREKEPSDWEKRFLEMRKKK